MLAPAALPAREAGFKLDYAPHPGMFENSAGKDIANQIAFAADMGFRAWEDNDMRGRDVAEQERHAAALRRNGMRMGIFVGAAVGWNEPTLARGDAASRQQFLADIESSVEVARRVGATWMTIVPGHVDPRIRPYYQMAHVVESLKQASAILEPHALVMVLEALNFQMHPGMLLTEIPQAYLICKAVGSPSCKILFDIYHQEISEGNIIPNIDDAWDEIGYFQVGDVPGRNEPTTGEINFRRIFEHLYGKGYDGIIGMEHGKSIDGVEGEKVLLRAYRESDDFGA
jgi:hydroxypyruvate isomerase